MTGTLNTTQYVGSGSGNSGSDSGTTIVAGGDQFVGVDSGTGATTSTTIDSGGYQNLGQNSGTGSAIDTTVNIGGLQIVGISDGTGTATSTTINSGGYQYLGENSGTGSATDTTVNSGGTQVVGWGDGTGTAISTTISGGGHQYVGGIGAYGGNGTAISTTILSGGSQNVGGVGQDTAIDTTISGGTQILANTGEGTTAAATSTTILSGGEQLVGFSNGRSGSATSTTVDIGGIQFVGVEYGTGTATDTILSGGEQSVGAGEGASGSYDGTGVAISTTIIDGGFQQVSSELGSGAATAIYTTISGGRLKGQGSNTFFQGSEQIVGGGASSFGTATSTTIDSGGIQQVGLTFGTGTAIATTINSGGVQYVGDFNSPAIGTATSTWLSGGTQYVNTGGTATDTAIYSGGLEEVLSGGVANSPVIDGGTLRLDAGASIGTGPIDFTAVSGTSGGTLDLTGDGSGSTFQTNFTAAISGFSGTGGTAALSDIIDVSGSGQAEDHVVWTQNGTSGTLQVENASNNVLESLTLDGTYGQQRFLLTETGSVDQITYDSSTAAPSVNVSADKSTLAAGQTATVTFTFSEPVTGFTNGDVTVSGGTLSAVTVDGTHPNIYTATFTPGALNSESGSLQVTGPYTDQAGNPGSNSNTVTFSGDTLDPTVSISADTSTLHAGDTRTVTFTFSEPVTGFTNGDVTVSGGTLSAVTVDGTHPNIYTATFTPGALNSESGSLQVTGPYTDQAGNPGSNSNTVTFSGDTLDPTVSISADTSTLHAGDTRTVTFTFSEPVTGFTNGDVTVSGGTLSAVTVDGTHPNIYTATFTPGALNSESGSLQVTGPYTDQAGNPGSNSNTVTFSGDTLDPTVSISADTSTLHAGDTRTVTFTFSEPVTGFTNGDVTVSGGTLSAVTVDGTHPNIYTATFTPGALNSESGSLQVTGPYTDQAGNPGSNSNTVTFSGDTLDPTVSISADTSTLHAGDTRTVTFTFSEPVTGFTNGDVTVSGGTLSAVTVDGTHPNIYTATFTPGALNSESGSLQVTGPYTDQAGNPGSNSNTVTFSGDTLDPTVSISADTSTLHAGDTRTVTFTFSEPVTGFTNGDVTVSGGTLSAVTVDGTHPNIYTATFTPGALNSESGSLQVTGPYTDQAGNPGSNSNTVTFTVDQSPTAPSDSDTASANQVTESATAGTYVGLTANSTDPDQGDTVTYSLTSDAGGFFQIDQNGRVTLTSAGATGIDYESTGNTTPAHTYTITVAATDSHGVASSSDFTIAVDDAPPSIPTDSDQTADSVAEGAAAGTAVGITASSADPNGGTVSYSLTNSAGGFFQISQSGVVTVSNAGAKGIDYESAPGHAYSITVQTSDGTLTSSNSFSIGVTDVAPTAAPDVYWVRPNTTLSKPIRAGVLVNDSDPNGGDLAALSVSGPAHASSFALSSDGSFTYTPQPGFIGTDSFTYQASDHTLQSAPATVTIMVENPPLSQTPNKADFNGDLTSDILFRNNTTGELGFLKMSGGVEQDWDQIGPASTAYSVVGTGDFNGDGTSDILFRNNTTGDVGFYEMANGQSQGWHDIGGSSTAYSVVGVGDFNGDGTSDVLFRNSTTGDLGFYEIVGGALQGWHDIGGSSTAFNVEGVGDFNRDGTSDVLFRNDTNGDMDIYQISNGTLQSFQDIASSPLYSVAGIGDFNGDLTSDILFRNNSGDAGDTGYYAMNNGALDSWHGLGSVLIGASVAGVGDYNGDGVSDILLQNASGLTSYYQTEGAAPGVNTISASSTAWSIPPT